MKPISMRLFQLIGFCAVFAADSPGRARHLTVRENDEVYVADSARGLNWRILYTDRSN
ncbi:MAG: hypothetical protein OXG94_12230 [Bacteroidetes bacterium]|nr:hypothetical protein [Bacteroidota bacterium]